MHTHEGSRHDWEWSVEEEVLLGTRPIKGAQVQAQVQVQKDKTSCYVRLAFVDTVALKTKGWKEKFEIAQRCLVNPKGAPTPSKPSRIAQNFTFVPTDPPRGQHMHEWFLKRDRESWKPDVYTNIFVEATTRALLDVRPDLHITDVDDAVLLTPPQGCAYIVLVAWYTKEPTPFDVDGVDFDTLLEAVRDPFHTTSPPTVVILPPLGSSLGSDGGSHVNDILTVAEWVARTNVFTFATNLMQLWTEWPGLSNGRHVQTRGWTTDFAARLVDRWVRTAPDMDYVASHLLSRARAQTQVQTLLTNVLDPMDIDVNACLVTTGSDDSDPGSGSGAGAGARVGVGTGSVGSTDIESVLKVLNDLQLDSDIRAQRLARFHMFCSLTVINISAAPHDHDSEPDGDVDGTVNDLESRLTGTGLNVSVLRLATTPVDMCTLYTSQTHEHQERDTPSLCSEDENDGCTWTQHVTSMLLDNFTEDGIVIDGQCMDSTTQEIDVDYLRQKLGNLTSKHGRRVRNKGLQKRIVDCTKRVIHRAANGVRLKVRSGCALIIACWGFDVDRADYVANEAARALGLSRDSDRAHVHVHVYPRLRLSGVPWAMDVKCALGAVRTCTALNTFTYRQNYDAMLKMTQSTLDVERQVSAEFVAGVTACAVNDFRRGCDSHDLYSDLYGQEFVIRVGTSSCSWSDILFVVVNVPAPCSRTPNLVTWAQRFVRKFRLLLEDPELRFSTLLQTDKDVVFNLAQHAERASNIRDYCDALDAVTAFCDWRAAWTPRKSTYIPDPGNYPSLLCGHFDPYSYIPTSVPVPGPGPVPVPAQALGQVLGQVQGQEPEPDRFTLFNDVDKAFVDALKPFRSLELTAEDMATLEQTDAYLAALDDALQRHVRIEEFHCAVWPPPLRLVSQWDILLPDIRAYWPAFFFDGSLDRDAVQTRLSARGSVLQYGGTNLSRTCLDTVVRSVSSPLATALLRSLKVA